MNDVRATGPDDAVLTSTEFRDELMKRVLAGDLVLIRLFDQLTSLESFYQRVKGVIEAFGLAQNIGLERELAGVALSTILEIGQQTATAMKERLDLTPLYMAEIEDGVRASKTYKRLVREGRI